MDEHAIGLIHPGEMGAEVGAEWARSIPGLAARVDALPGVSSKAWRFEGGMLEIAETFEAAGGLPPGGGRTVRPPGRPAGRTRAAGRRGPRGSAPCTPISARSYGRGMKTISPVPSMVPNCGVCWLREAFVTCGFTPKRHSPIPPP